MRLLLVKTSSMGDVIHTFAALTDAKKARPDLEIDWLVEEGFADVARLHPAVARVIPVAMRRWRRALFSATTRREVTALRRTLRAADYDLVLDAQGLVKSAILSKLAGRPVDGLDGASLREPLARFAYARRHAVPKGLHAVERLRRLFGAALGYTPDLTRLDWGLAARTTAETPTVMLLHGTSWPSKRWPTDCWIDLARLVADAGLVPTLTWSDPDEEEVAAAVAEAEPRTHVIPRSRLAEVAAVIASARAVVGTDTGLTHLAAAYDRPTVAIFLSTAPGLTAPRGAHVTVLAPAIDCAPCRRPQCPRVAVGARPPCVATVAPDRVAEALADLADAAAAAPRGARA